MPLLVAWPRPQLLEGSDWQGRWQFLWEWMLQDYLLGAAFALHGERL
jgi:hypothetical protein